MAATQITLSGVDFGHGEALILSQVDWVIHSGTHMGLIGRNGVGKSSVLSLLLGHEQPDSGTVSRQPGLTISSMAQFDDEGFSGTVVDCLMSVVSSHEPKWQTDQHVEQLLTHLSLDPTAEVHNLSGGQRRKVALAQALLRKADVLLLDEPTNHLDMPAIAWLQEHLKSLSCTWILITHDRHMLQQVASSIVEIDRGQLYAWQGDYQGYLRFKAQQDEALVRQQAQFDKRLVNEERWIRQGVKARRTRNEGRVRALKAMREAHQERRKTMGKTQFRTQDVAKSGHMIFETHGLSFAHQSKPMVSGLDVRITRGEKIGIVGPNGCGKTTLLRLLLGELQPLEGQVRRGQGLTIGYFDQKKQDIDPNKTVVENVAQGAEFIDLKDKRVHVLSYLQDFLFSPARARTAAKYLSGGERCRVLLARLFTQPTNILILDEPTNDLDIETLEVLEALLVSYSGTVLLISHDRTFLDHTVSSLLVHQDKGKWLSFVGGYSDYMAHQASLEQQQKKAQAAAPNDQPVKRNHKHEQKLMKTIDRLEKLKKSLEGRMAEQGFYQQDPEQVSKVAKSYEKTTLELDQNYKKWENLQK